MNKKILFVGVFEPKHSNNNLQYNAFKEKGFEIKTFDYRKNIHKNRNKIKKKINKYLIALQFLPFPLNRIYYREKAKKKTQNKLLNLVKKEKFDLIFLSKIEELDYKIIEELNKYAPTFYYFMDPPTTSKIIKAKQYAKRCNYASATFTSVVNEFNEIGGNATQILEGVDKGKKFNEKKTRDVIFVGSIDKKRKNIIEYIKNSGIEIEVFGPDTKNGPIYGDNLYREYAKSKIILNIARKGGGFSLRVLEAMKSGSFLLSEYAQDIEVFFTKGKELDWFGSKEECVKKIKYYLENQKEREHIALKGENKVINKHTWNNQIKQIMEHVKW